MPTQLKEPITADPEWPKFWISHDEECVMQADNVEDLGTFYDKDKNWKAREGFKRLTLVEHVQRFGLKQIPRTEAERILGREV